MQTNLTPRYLIIAAILGWAIYTLSPTWQYHNMSVERKEELRTSGKLGDIESRIIRQGLDLKGGMYIVLEADIPTLMTNLASVKDERLESIISAAKESSSTLNLDFFTEFEKNVRSNEIKLSRYYHEYGASLDDIMIALKEEADDAINRVLEILQNRVDQFGVSEPTIQKQGKHRIVVELAGIQDSDRARSLLQSTALLEFYLVKNVAVTNEIIAQLDEALKDKNALVNEPIQKEEQPLTDEAEEDETKTVSELFGESDNPNDPQSVETNSNDIFADAPFSSLLTPLPGDMGVEEKYVYALKKLLKDPKVQSKLNSANGQFLLSQESQSASNANTQDKYYRLYYLEN